MIHLREEDFYRILDVTSHMRRCIFEPESYPTKFSYMTALVSDIVCVELIFRTYEFEMLCRRGSLLC